jgi:hypothetical protein
MTKTNLHEVASTMLTRAQRQGFVLPSDVRGELVHCGMSEAQWQDVIALIRPSLRLRQGRYYHQPAVSARLREEKTQQRAIQQAVRSIIVQYRKASAEKQRRRQDRTDFVQPVKVRTEDQRERTLLSRDLSRTGIRLIGTDSLLGQKVQVFLPRPDRETPTCFLVRILWTCTVGDGLFENGGAFLQMVDDQHDPLQAAGARTL